MASEYYRPCKELDICNELIDYGGMNIWQMRITNLARNLTFAMS